MKFINIGRSDEECREKVLQDVKNADYNSEKYRKKCIKKTEKLPIEEIRYIDNQLRIYYARKNWDKLRSKFNCFF